MNTNNFQDYVNIHVCCEKVCPRCKRPLKPHIIHYSKKENEVIKKKNINGYRCEFKYCHSFGALYLLDYDVENIETINTNIKFLVYNYNKLYIKDIIYVNSNLDKCTLKNHKLYKFSTAIPLIQPDGKIKFSYTYVSYCNNCDRIIILKDIYKNLKGVPACQVIDETKEIEIQQSNKGDIYISSNDKTKIKLKQLGYNISCNDKLTPKQRETILEAITTIGLLTKDEIIDYINKNINNEEQRDIIKEWEYDKKFIQSISETTSIINSQINKIICKYTFKKFYSFELYNKNIEINIKQPMDISKFLTNNVTKILYNYTIPIYEDDNYNLNFSILFKDENKTIFQSFYSLKSEDIDITYSSKHNKIGINFRQNIPLNDLKKTTKLYYSSNYIDFYVVVQIKNPKGFIQSLQSDKILRGYNRLQKKYNISSKKANNYVVKNPKPYSGGKFSHK